MQNASGTYLVNLLDGVIEYYRVNLADPTDNREVVTADKLVRLTDADAAAAASSPAGPTPRRSRISPTGTRFIGGAN